jgi:hypothetical protein
MVDLIVADLESRGLGWSLDHTGNLIEARIWRWPYVVGRYRPAKVLPLEVMLSKAYDNANVSKNYPIKPHTQQ